MSKNKKKNQIPKSLKPKGHNREQVSVSEAITTLKEEIVEEVKDLAQAKIRSVYNLVEKGKELLELESGKWSPKSDGAETKSPENASKPGEGNTPNSVSAQDF